MPKTDFKKTAATIINPKLGTVSDKRLSSARNADVDKAYIHANKLNEILKNVRIQGTVQKGLKFIGSTNSMIFLPKIRSAPRSEINSAYITVEADGGFTAYGFSLGRDKTNLFYGKPRNAKDLSDFLDIIVKEAKRQKALEPEIIPSQEPKMPARKPAKSVKAKPALK